MGAKDSQWGWRANDTLGQRSVLAKERTYDGPAVGQAGRTNARVMRPRRRVKDALWRSAKDTLTRTINWRCAKDALWGMKDALTNRRWRQGRSSTGCVKDTLRRCARDTVTGTINWIGGEMTNTGTINRRRVKDAQWCIKDALFNNCSVVMMHRSARGHG